MPKNSDPRQMEFGWRDEAGLRHELERETGLSLRLTLTDNVYHIMTMKPLRQENRVALRIHRMFLTADTPVVKALAGWVRRPRRGVSSRVLDQFIRGHRHLIRKGPAREASVQTAGRHHNLRAMFDGLNRTHFGGAVTARITWGNLPRRSARGKRRRSIRFGSYTAEDHIIRLHPFLDQPFVPEYFVRYIVFHEMLHAALGSEEDPDSGRRCVHTREFKQRERAYPDYPRATAWQNESPNIRRLLRYRPDGKARAQ
ncbi:MAG: hypothetical protein HY706_12300 [Candidatus Hydrogenedentes bacterium]|nr:hypothetical protein [Candidatus Hydrogenedentota bacterium]